MQRLQGEGIQEEITDIWNKLGQEGEGEELKLAAHHCLLGVQDTLSHPQEYNLLQYYASTLRQHPEYKDFLSFRKEVESGKYKIHFSLEKMRNQDGSRSVYLSTWAQRNDQKTITSEVRGNIEKWALTLGLDALETDINRILNLLEHAQPLNSQLFKSKSTTSKAGNKSPKQPKPGAAS